MVVGQIAEPVDLLVIGAGPGGYVAALRAAELGREVVLVERGGPEGGPGGSCLHVGCIPSKALIELGEGRERGQRLAEAGLRADAAEVDLTTFQSWKQGIVDDLAGGVESLLDAAKVRRIPGNARFANPDRVAVTTPDGNAARPQTRRRAAADLNGGAGARRAARVDRRGRRRLHRA
jgi:dihydrolipoamide dehydrogenase